jgi:hypothetical protein
MKSDPELDVVDMVEDLVNAGMLRESREEARARRLERVDMLVRDPMVALMFVMVGEIWESRALVGLVWESVIGNVGLETRVSLVFGDGCFVDVGIGCGDGNCTRAWSLRLVLIDDFDL